MGQTVIITGGVNTERKVTQYNEDGQHKELPELISGRYEHGCSSFVDSSSYIVSNSYTSYLFIVNNKCNIVLTRFCW